MSAVDPALTMCAEQVQRWFDTLAVVVRERRAAEAAWLRVDSAVAAAVAAGATREDLAYVLGVAETTVRRWYDTPGGRPALPRRIGRRELLAQAVAAA